MVNVLLYWLGFALGWVLHSWGRRSRVGWFVMFTFDLLGFGFMIFAATIEAIHGTNGFWWDLVAMLCFAWMLDKGLELKRRKSS